MRVLHLTLKKKWFDMIASGEKTEEYREIKPYWDKRLCKKYDIIKFRNGYSKNAPSLVILNKLITKDLGNMEWGAPEGEDVYVLKLGAILEVKV